MFVRRIAFSGETNVAAGVRFEADPDQVPIVPGLLVTLGLPTARWFTRRDDDPASPNRPPPERLAKKTRSALWDASPARHDDAFDGPFRYPLVPMRFAFFRVEVLSLAVGHV